MRVYVRAHTYGQLELSAMKGSVCTLLLPLLVPAVTPARPAVFRHLRFAKRSEKKHEEAPPWKSRLRGRASEPREIRVYARTINARAEFIARETGNALFTAIANLPRLPPRANFA